MMMLELHLVIFLDLICVGFFHILKFINQRLIISLPSNLSNGMIQTSYRLSRAASIPASWQMELTSALLSFWSSDQFLDVNIIGYARFTTNCRKPHSLGIELFDCIRRKILLNEFEANESDKWGGNVTGNSFSKLFFCHNHEDLT